MERQRVNSSLALSVGYNPETMVLEIEFRPNGLVWQYFEIPEWMYHDMMSGSIGKYFNQHIKGQYTEKQMVDNLK